MKEINITVNKQDIEYLQYVKQNVNKKKSRQYFAICEINDMAVLSIATADEDFASLIAKLKYYISEITLHIYKEKYLIENIDFKNLPAAYKTALLKALVLFDSDNDKQFIKSKLNFENDIYLDSFYNFCLTELKSRWQEIATLANENNLNLLESDTFLDLLKFLIATIKPKTNLVNVYYNGNNFEYFDRNQKKIKTSNISESEPEVGLITTLITLAPNNINLHCINVLSNNTFKVLYYIFDKKVNLLV